MNSFIVVEPNSAANSSDWYLVVRYDEWLESFQRGWQLAISGRNMFGNYHDAWNHRNNLNKELVSD